MGRELRRVPADWQHPRKASGAFIPMHDRSFEKAAAEWKAAFLKWEAGEREDYCKDETCEFWEWEGDPPERDGYRPDWPEESRTHFQMYENTSEGTPISPVFDNIESLARWLADTGASAFGGMTATYEEWLAMCRHGYAPSMVVVGGRMMSGVEALDDAAVKR